MSRQSDGVVTAGISEVLDAVLEDEPDRLAVVGPTGGLTYRQLDDAANAAAAVLGELGVGRGDRVAGCLPNDLDIVVAFHAVMRLGAIWVGINQALAAPEKQAVLTDADAGVLISENSVAESLTGLSSRQQLQVLTVDSPDAATRWGDLVAAARGARRPPRPDIHAPAGLAYTSGTTGMPRGVIHSQHNLMLPAAALVASREYDVNLRKGDFLPLTILNLMVLSTLLAATAGGRCILMDRRDSAGVTEWIRRESVTVWNGVPALLHRMLHDVALDPVELGSLREVWTGGADCPEHLRAAFEKRFHVRVFATYGLTEAPTVVTIDPLDQAHVAGASGTPLPHIDLRIVGDDGAELPRGAEGEIEVAPATSGDWAGRYTPMLGYWGEDASTRPERTLRTGDIGRVGEGGWLFVRDRKKLVIIRGGANVYPAEVERVIMQVPGVQGCAVLGIPDERLGQRVVAVIQATEPATVTEEALSAACRENLARYKVPERFVVVAELPRNAMGKVQRPALLELVLTDTREE